MFLPFWSGRLVKFACSNEVETYRLKRDPRGIHCVKDASQIWPNKHSRDWLRCLWRGGLNCSSNRCWCQCWRIIHPITDKALRFVLFYFIHFVTWLHLGVHVPASNTNASPNQAPACLCIPSHHFRLKTDTVRRRTSTFRPSFTLPSLPKTLFALQLSPSLFSSAVMIVFSSELHRTEEEGHVMRGEKTCAQPRWIQNPPSCTVQSHSFPTAGHHNAQHLLSRLLTFIASHLRLPLTTTNNTTTPFSFLPAVFQNHKDEIWSKTKLAQTSCHCNQPAQQRKTLTSRRDVHRCGKDLKKRCRWNG